MSGTAERPSNFPWATTLFAGAAILALILGAFYPLPWITQPLSDILFAIGLLLAAGAVALYVTSIRTMRRAKTTIWPHQAASHLVTSGPFSFSRHPIYLGNMMLITGLALITGNVWFLICGLLAAVGTQKLAAEPEERHMEVKFGKKYRDYAKRVRRWI